MLCLKWNRTGIMKRIALFAFSALVLTAVASCHREEPLIPDDGTYTYSLSVWNSDYIQDVILEEMGQVKLSSVEGLPAWVSGVTLSEELLKGNSVAQISVNRNPGLEEKLTADITLKMTNGATAKLNLAQWPSRPVENAPVQSVNTAFQKDWAGTEMITIVTGNRYINGIPELVTETVRLPWAQNSNHHLPKGEVTKMLDHKGDWRMVFNFTGVQSLPGCHYFGLYNRYSGILRVFYYLHKNDVPTNGNDHLWSFELDESLAQHVASQFALPYNETATYDFKKYAAQPFLVTPYANRADGLSNGKYLPTQDWWAFDVDMSAARNHDFFSEKPGEYASRIGMKLYKEDNVMLNSVLKGCLDGALKGKINLDQLAPNGTSVGGSVTGGILGGVGDVFTNKFILEQLSSKKLGVAMVIGGCVLSTVGKILESEWKDDDDPSSKLGSINADINLDRMMEMAHQLNGNAADFTFMFSGNYDEALLRQYIEQYIASLPSTGKATSKGKEIRTFANGVKKCSFTKEMQNPQSQAQEIWRSNPMKYTLEKMVLLNVSYRLLDMTFNREIRERLSAAYHAGADIDLDVDGPNIYYTLKGVGKLNPDKALGAIPEFQKGMDATVASPNLEDLQKAKQIMLKQADEDAKTNSHWLNVMTRWILQGVDIETNYKKTVEAVTPAAISNFLKNDILKSGNHIEVVMMPEKK